MRAFPWDAAMRFGLGILKLHPDQFWAMTPRELSAAFDAHQPVQSAAPSRADLNQLINAFPDKEVSLNG